MGVLTLSACAQGSSASRTVQATTTINGNPGLRFSDGSIVERSGNTSEPIFNFHMVHSESVLLNKYCEGIMSISNHRVRWQTSSNTDSFDELRSNVHAALIKIEGIPAIKVEAARRQYKYFAGSDRLSLDFFVKAVLDFPAAEEEFWRLRDDPLPPSKIAAFQQQAAAWRALAVKPELPEETRRQRTLAESYLREKDFKSSIEHYKLGVKADLTWPEGWFNLALLYGETGDYSAAAASMKNYLALMPDSPDAPAARDKIVIWEDKATHQK
jgi:tetratricopeptide (TPR) repeat protein